MCFITFFSGVPIHPTERAESEHVRIFKYFYIFFTMTTVIGSIKTSNRYQWHIGRHNYYQSKPLFSIQVNRGRRGGMRVGAE